MDRSSLMRKFLLNQMKEYRMGQSANKYKRGVVSLAEAATLAKVSLYEMMEYCEKERIRPPDSKEEDVIAEFEDAREIFKNMPIA